MDIMIARIKSAIRSKFTFHYSLPVLWRNTSEFRAYLICSMLKQTLPSFLSGASLMSSEGGAVLNPSRNKRYLYPQHSPPLLES
jgi:hypothetical protein